MHSKEVKNNTMSYNLIKVDFLNFFKNPNQKFMGPFKRDFLIFLILTLLNFFCVFVKSLFTHDPFIDEGDLAKFNSAKLFSFVLLIPLIEELVFRGFLQYKSRLIFMLSAIAVLFFTSSFIKLETASTAILVMVSILSLIVLFNKRAYHAMLRFIARNTIAITLISAILFGFVHLFNYDTFIWLNLIPIAEKIISGLFLCYIAKKYSIWHSYFFHALNNLIPFLLIVLYQLIQ